MNILTLLFAGFFTLIVVFQVVPAVIMFLGMIKGLLKKEAAE